MKINTVYLPGQDEVTGYNNPTKIIIHHPEFFGTIEQLNSVMRSMGFTMIGYNYYIRKNGSVWKGRPDNVTSGNCYNQNTKSLGVCFEGNYDKDKEMPKAQFDAGVELIKYLKSKYGISEVNGHKNYYNTDCPGKYFPLDKMLAEVNNNTNKKVVINSNPNLWEICINGQIVKDLQSELNKQFGANLKVDGWFGQSTLDACPLVKEGAHGNITKIIQRRLLERNYTSLLSHGGADGYFGEGTTTAIKNLQRNKNLTADGIVGKDTWKNLFLK